MLFQPALRLALAILALVLCPMLSRADDAPRPNVILIMADDFGFSDLGCYGSEIDTPNLDKLAANGVKFTQFYNTARCCPTRASLLTGLYPHQAGVGHMTKPLGDFPGYAGNLSKQARTIAEVLKPAGYSTYMVGKWHVTSNDLPTSPQDNWPLQRGFDRFYGTIRGGGSFYDPATLTRDNTPITPEGDAGYKPQGQYYYTDAIADHSVRFIRDHHTNVGDKPFFLYTAFTAPHWPLHAPADVVAKYKGKYDAGYEPVRAARFERMKQLGVIDAKSELTPAPWKWEDQEKKDWEARCMEVYAAQVDRMDAGVGRILAALSETGQLDNTLILFLADNGACAENMGRDVHEDRATAKPIAARQPDEIQKEVFPKFTPDGRPIRDGRIVMPGPDESYVAYGEGWANVSNTPFREYKHWVHEGGISSPLVAHWPAGFTRRGEWERQPGHLIDLMATCVDVSGADYPKEANGRPVPGMEGVSLVPAFRGERLSRKRPIFWEHEGNRAIRDGDWKLVAKRDKPWELYNIASDRSELHDLAAKEPERVKSMSAAWQEWAEASQVLPLNPGRAAKNARKPAAAMK